MLPALSVWPMMAGASVSPPTLVSVGAALASPPLSRSGSPESPSAASLRMNPLAEPPGPLRSTWPSAILVTVSPAAMPVGAAMSTAASLTVEAVTVAAARAVPGRSATAPVESRMSTSCCGRLVASAAATPVSDATRTSTTPSVAE